MKNFKIKALIALLAVNFVSCDNYLDINEDPNNPQIEQVHPALMLPGAMTGAYRVQSRTMNQLGNIWMQNWGGDVNNFTGANTDEYQMQLSNSFYSGIWDGLYPSMANFTQITKFDSPDYDNHKAVAYIMRAFYMQYIVDLYGDAPFKEAFQLAANITPAYDDDKEIYRTLITDIDNGVQMFYDADSNDKALGTSDVIFAGNVNKWIRFANTLKLRILLRQSNLTDAETVTYLNDQFAVLDGAIFLEDNVLINPGYSNATTGQMNPFYALFKTTANENTQFYNFARATDYVGSFLSGTAAETTGLTDPRGARLYNPQGGQIVGAVQGETTGPDPMSEIGTGLIRTASSDGVIMSFAETNFLLAEAALKGYLPSIAGMEQMFFDNGVTASFQLLGLTAGDAATYLGNASGYPNVGWNGDFMQAIMTQKWIACNGFNGIESFIEMNRTGFPVLPMPTTSLFPNRPYRLLYPTSELVANSANVPSVQLSQIFTQGPFWKN